MKCFWKLAPFQSLARLSVLAGGSSFPLSVAAGGIAAVSLFLFCCGASVGNQKSFASASLAYFYHFSGNLCPWLRCALCAAVAVSPAHFYASLVVTVLPCLGRHVFTGSSFGVVSGPCKSWQQRYVHSQGFVTKQKNDN